MNRKESVDEFEVLFKQASIPVLDIPVLEINPISIVLEDESLDQVMGFEWKEIPYGCCPFRGAVVEVGRLHREKTPAVACIGRLFC